VLGKVKKSILFSVLLLGLLSIVFSSSTDVSAARGAFSKTCTLGGDPNNTNNSNNPDDTNFFPFGFLCGTFPTNQNGSYNPPLVPYRLVDLRATNLTTNSDVVNESTISNNDTVRVSGRFYDQNGHTPKKQRNRDGSGPFEGQALAWITIDTGRGASTSTIIPRSAGAGPERKCPGVGAENGGPGPVFGYRDLRKDYKVTADTYDGAFEDNSYRLDGTSTRVNGVNASPVAYNKDTGGGVVNCGEYGRMVYWKNAQSGTAYEFDIKLPRTTGDRVCIRMNVSVLFDSDNNQYFPDHDDDFAPRQQNVAASHIVKQSNEICYTGSRPPGPSIDASLNYRRDCANLDGKIDTTLDGVQSDTNYHYYVQRWNPAADVDGVDTNGDGQFPDGAWEDVPGSFALSNPDGSFSTAIDGAAYFGNGRDVAFQVLVDKDKSAGGVNYEAFPAPGTGGYVTYDDCVNNPPALGVDEPSCLNLTISGYAYDDDTPDAIAVHIYVDSDPAAKVVTASQERGGAYNGFSWAIPESLRDGINHSFRVYAIDVGGTNNTGPISKVMTGCGAFKLTPAASGGLNNNENPVSYRATGNVTPEYTGWSPSAGKPAISGYASTYTVASTAKITKEGVNIKDDPGHSSFTYRAHDFTYTGISSPVAGQNYCTVITAQPKSGIIENTGKILSADTTVAESSSCDPVVNKPFFKVIGSGIEAGGDFEDSGNCSGGGTIGGWNNNLTAVANYGAGTSLHALALAKIVGVASGRTAYNRAPASAIAFGNSNEPAGSATGTSNYSPALGGYYGAEDGTGSLPCWPDLKSTTAPSGDDTQISGQTLEIGSNVEKFVNGDAYITGDIKYRETGRSFDANGKTNIPSYKLVVTGNIYIHPDVEQLDGIYSARGNIYTCTNPGDPYKPISRGSVFDTCGKQLIVRGTFLAKKVAMLRTYGSLRDETPTESGATTREETYEQPTNQNFAFYTNGELNSRGYGPPFCTTLEGLRQDYSLDGRDRSRDSICVEPEYHDMTLKWTKVNKNHDVARAKQNTGLDYCAEYISARNNDRFFLCSDYEISFSDTPNKPGWICEQDEIGGPFVGVAAHICEKITTITEDVPVPGTFSRPLLNTAAKCSHSGGVAPKHSTCAAEIFIFSPEQFLSNNPTITPQNSGAPAYDAITSLPPVL
jgi:hypothetical protein